MSTMSFGQHEEGWSLQVLPEVLLQILQEELQRQDWNLIPLLPHSPEQMVHCHLPLLCTVGGVLHQRNLDRGGDSLPQMLRFHQDAHGANKEEISSRFFRHRRIR